ncbi:hypothetical protein DVH24_039854 [Malus domestica]|uniref:Uncharacterized protein n=1 Tax=Malus domestica TaxID=3750 RepID=A0A498I9T8_MALDO|nr:hypothetical protein DVH24_039854 [Malus domestica]
MGLVDESHRARSTKIGTVISHSERSRAAESRGAGRHSCERKAKAGLGQVVRSKRNWTTGSMMLSYW